MSIAHDWRTLDLAPGGRSLIEASAGTGKTWTIGALYLRLLLERGLAPRRIVVSTFTHAAATELKERLRARIEQALALAHEGVPHAPDAQATDLCWLHDRWHGEDARRRADANVLALALAELDIAPIGTLHSLCTRILAEHPFAARAAFRTPELVDAGAMREQLSDDLWRVLHGDDDDEANAALRAAAAPLLGGLSRKKIAALLKLLLQPGVRVPESGQELAPWESAQVEPLRELASAPEVWAKNAALPAALNQAADAIASCGTDSVATALDTAALVQRAANRTGVLKAAQSRADVIEVLDFAVRFAESLERWHRVRFLSFLRIIQTWARSQIDARLARANQLGFDDLLTTVLAALQPDAQGQRALADALFAQWPVAMIDEFQDTDPHQYGILDAIHRDADGALRGRLLLIGDPKQAIYRFRGGDIRTYERASAAVPSSERLVLDVNRRSTPAYVAAVNALYAQVGERLGAPGSSTPIHYAKVQASAAAEPSRFTHAGHPAAALTFHDDSAQPAGDDTAALLSCASRIAAMLDPAAGWRIEGRPLRASDICVLVPRNSDVQRITRFLRQRGIATVNRGRASVFRGDTARDLLQLLDAVAHCQQAGRVRAAVATRLWGMGYQPLRALREDAAGWQALVSAFHQWQHAWHARGVLAVVLALMRRIAAQHLATRDGERTLTDLRHLGELLQEAEERSDGMASLLAWFRSRIESGEAGDDAAEAQALRLESDARCAQVMTLHASKGLEFNLVFLPLMGTHRGARSLPDLGVLSRPDGTRELALDLAGRTTVALEEQDERFRVLYVVLTRARLACEVWLPSQDAALNDRHAVAAPLALYAERIRAAHAGEAAPAFAVQPEWPPITDQRVPRDDEVATPRTARALPPPRSGPLPARHSFTTLVAHERASTDPGASAQDEDGVDGSALVLPETAIALAPDLPRTRAAALDALLGVAGADFGNAVHAILEHRRVGVPLREQQALVRAALDDYAVRHPQQSGEAFAQHLAARLDGALDADLDAAGLRLAALPARDLRCEMAFHYRLDGASLARLRTTCAADMIPPREEALVGLMNGKIDLVFRHAGRFHVLDWKGNNLGRFDEACLEDYAPAALEAAMDAASYRFQALLYTVALERYLAQRLGAAYRRDEHLGDAWYLFVRATGLHLPDGTPCGIWRHRFDDALLDAVQRELATTQGATA